MAWTSPDPVVADTTMARQIHREELCTAVNADLSARGAAPVVWTDTPGPGNVDTVDWRAVHITELRGACTTDYNRVIAVGGCNTNILVPPSWTPPDPVVADETLIRVTHLQELRVYITALQATCNCNCNPQCSCVGYVCSCNGHSHCCCEGHCISTKKAKESICDNKFDSLSIIKNLRVVNFRYKKEFKNTDEVDERIGIITEESPDLLSLKDKSKLDMANIIGVLLDACQKLAKRVEELEAHHE